jgi:hypothetical protein
MIWRDQTWNVLLALLGAVIGLIGVGSGFLGSLYLQRRTDREARRAAGRAVLAEMFANVDRALSAESSLVLHQFSDLVWQQQLPLVAHLLGWNDLRTLVNTYDSASRAFENAKERIGVDESQRMGGSANELGKVMFGFRDIAKEWLTAIRVLQGVVLSKAERSALEEDIVKLESRL